MDRSEKNQKDIEFIINQYELQFQYSESFGRVFKVYTTEGTFALKKISPLHSMDFIKHVQRLYQRGYNRVVPIYLTSDGRYGVLYQNNLYYLMPWLNNEDYGERNEKHKQMFRELARMHVLTAKDLKIEKEDREIHYQKTTDTWEKQQKFLEEFIERCEKKWYMSPFELMFCSYYYDVSQALSFSTKKLEEWYDKTKDDEKVRTVVIHGKISIKHFLINDRGAGYFINFENSKSAPQHFDLLPFFVKYCNSYPARCDECIEWLYHYYKYYPMREEEMMLFLSYLAYPTQFLQTVEAYHERKYDLQSEYQYVKQLQKNYWQLKNIEYIVMKIDEIEAQKKAAQAEGQDSE
ncbi:MULTISPECIES: spore coat protein YsxE [Bacillus]|uniref:spore coat protein YsxE n=1 Tax=Bacillus TaxID=1386 RepID=UPI0002FB6BEA|nr:MULTISPECIES: spore coat protein YsxE [Bacillus]